VNDDRIFCGDCKELRVWNGDCLSAREGRRLDVGPRYGHADLDLPHRCAFFLAKKGAEDQRSGRERFPWLFAEYEQKQAERNQFNRDLAVRGLERAKAAIS
jgi:hypothetical protein